MLERACKITEKLKYVLGHEEKDPFLLSCDTTDIVYIPYSQWVDWEAVSFKTCQILSTLKLNNYCLKSNAKETLQSADQNRDALAAHFQDRSDGYKEFVLPLSLHCHKNE